jgi:mRNA interferase MazF
MTYSFADVLLLHFPYTDSSETKPRPVIVLIDVGDDDLLVARVTSQEPRGSYDVVLTEWEEAGLKLLSIVRLHKLVTLHKRRIIRGLGKLSSKDVDALKTKLKEMWDA